MYSGQTEVRSEHLPKFLRIKPRMFTVTYKLGCLIIFEFGKRIVILLKNLCMNSKPAVSIKIIYNIFVCGSKNNPALLY